MRRRWSLIALAVAGLVLAGCQSVNQAAVQAESYSQETLEDPVLPAGPGGTIVVEAFEWGFEIVENNAREGPVTVEIRNTGGAPHDFTVDTAAGEIKSVPEGTVPAGESATGTLQLFSGEIVFYCSVPGHRAQGMEGTLEVATA